MYHSVNFSFRSKIKNYCSLILFSSLILAFFTSIISCQKEISFEGEIQPGSDTAGNNLPTNTSRDTIYINRIVRTLLRSGSYDTVMVTLFTYDNQRRLKSWRDYPTTNLGYPESMEFSYNGTDTLPNISKYTIKATGSADSVIQYYHFFYDNTARKIKDSVLKVSTTAPINSGWVDQFYYFANKSVTVGKYQDPASVYLYKDTSTLDAQNNIVDTKFYSGANYDYLYHATFNFDNKNHIYSKCNIRKAIPKNTGGGFSHKYSGANNISFQKIDYFSSADQITNTITYNQYNFPLTLQCKYYNDDYKFHFFYRTLP